MTYGGFKTLVLALERIADYGFGLNLFNKEDWIIYYPANSNSSFVRILDSPDISTPNKEMLKKSKAALQTYQVGEYQKAKGETPLQTVVWEVRSGALPTDLVNTDRVARVFSKKSADSNKN